MTEVRNFGRLDQADDNDLALIVAESQIHPPQPAKHVLQLFRSLEHVPAKGHPINVFQHGLQSATLAMEAGEDDEYIAVALLHDIGDEIAPHNHGQFAAKLLEPFVSEANRWLLEYHAPFQGYYFWHAFGMDRNARDAYSAHVHADHTRRFVDKYDMPAFDAERLTPGFSHFEPIVRKLFSQAPKRRDAAIS